MTRSERAPRFARRALVALLALPLMPACQCSEPAPVEPPAVAGETPRSTAPAGPAADDARTPADLARAWDAVRRAPIEERGRRGKALADGWINRRYTWTGYALASLCVDARRLCALNPWERETTPALDAVRGQSPQVTFTPAAYDQLRRGCAGQTGCVVTVRAVLREIVSDPVEPLYLELADAEVVETRAPREGERWFGQAADAPKPPSRGALELPGKEPPLRNIPTIAPRVFRAPDGAAPAAPAGAAPALPTEDAPGLPTETPPATATETPPAAPPAKP